MEGIKSTRRIPASRRGRVHAAAGAFAALLVVAITTLALPPGASATWVQPVETPLGPSGVVAGAPSIVAGSGDAFHASVEGGSAGQVSLYSLAVGAQSWSVLGGAVSDAGSTGLAAPKAIAIAGVPYVAWQQDSALGVPSIFVRRWNPSTGPGTWDQVFGALNIDASKSASQPSIGVAAGVPYVAFAQATSSTRKTRVVKLGATGWDPVGSALNRSSSSDAVAPQVTTFGDGAAVVWIEDVAGERHAYADSIDAAGLVTPLGDSIYDATGVVKSCRAASWAGALVAGCIVTEAGIDRFEVARYSVASGWEPLGGALNVTAGDAAGGAITAIGDALYGLHRESIAGQQRLVLTRYDSIAGQWDALPEFVGQDTPASSDLTGGAGIPWVAATSTTGEQRVFQLAPSVTDIDITANETDASVTAFVDDFRLPYSISATAVHGASTAVGVVSGAGMTKTVTFNNLLAGSDYELEFRATDPTGREFVVARSAFVTDPAVAAFDDDQPEAKLTFSKRTKKSPRIRGIASDSGVGVARVEVAVESVHGSTCAWLRGSRFVKAACDAVRWIPANGTTKFAFPMSKSIKRALVKHAYVVFARSIDRAGNVSEVVAYRCTKYVRAKHARGAAAKKPASKCSEWR